MTFGKRLAELRENKNLTQIKLAELSGVSRSRLSLYETDKREPDLETLKLLADFFSTTTDELLGRDDLHVLVKMADMQLENENLLINLALIFQETLGEDHPDTDNIITMLANQTTKPHEITAITKKHPEIHDKLISLLNNPELIEKHVGPKQPKKPKDLIKLLEQEENNLTLNGEILSLEDLEIIKSAVEQGYHLAKKLNKRKKTE